MRKHLGWYLLAAGVLLVLVLQEFDKPLRTTPDLRTPLMKAVESGTLEEAERLLAAGADVSAKGIRNLQALHYAIGRNDPAFVTLLLAHGANPFIKDYADRTILHCAARQEAVDLRIWDLLLNAGVDVNSQSPAYYHVTPLYELVFFSSHNRYDEIRHLLERGADPSRSCTSAGRTVFDLAQQRDDPELDKILAPYRERRPVLSHPAAKPTSTPAPE